ncbi:hypothetical protein MC7420_5235 [Coleofasciculus chthonoplastes PCC 7420]|uniref:Uncharacterized protein n=1 Tax=Coleofasciculus chthonoplastes PCC 7420 TaxID=118168 RepID=B4W2I3_9CYAN|nr:hypothetical protein MC7420_5235 [Coleofasciculus chthonoplastes PCC 7420]
MSVQIQKIAPAHDTAPDRESGNLLFLAEMTNLLHRRTIHPSSLSHNSIELQRL